MKGAGTSAAVLVSAFLLTACGGTDLKADDPSGYKACQLYVESKSSDDPVMKIGLPMLEIGDLASQASTGAIRDSVKPLTDPALAKQYGMPQTWNVDDRALAEACEANGVHIP